MKLAGFNLINAGDVVLERIETRRKSPTTPLQSLFPNKLDRSLSRSGWTACRCFLSCFLKL